MKINPILCLIAFTFVIFCLNVSAQTRKSPQLSNKSTLTEAELPVGGVRIRQANRSNKIKTMLTDLVTSIDKKLLCGSKSKFSQGNSEVVSWTAVDKIRAEQLIKKIESGLSAANWKYESLQNKIGEPTSFSLSRTQPKSRQLAGFSVTESDTLTLAITELIPVAADSASANNGATNNVDVTGKWNMIGEAMKQSIPVTLELIQCGETVKGTFSSHLGNGTIQDIKVTGNVLDALAKVEVQGQIVELKLKGNVDRDKMTGTLIGKGLPPINFTATRVR